MESPSLCGWFNLGISWKWWIVGVGSCISLLAGFESHLGSVPQEFLGSTTAESFFAYWSWCLSSICSRCWVCANSSCISAGWEGSLLIISSLDCGSLCLFSSLFSKESLHGFLSFVVSNTLAGSNSGSEVGSSGSDGFGVSSNKGIICGDLSINGSLIC